MITKGKFSCRCMQFFLLMTVLCSVSDVGAQKRASYLWSSSGLFWFMIISDTHIGASGTQATDYLTWAVTEAREIIDPSFIVNAGDLTDSTNGGIIPDGPYQEEWDTYGQILEAAGIDATFYYDIPGNHDAYNDAHFAYYLANSIQGRAEGSTQHSWTREFPFGRYSFLGVCTAGNDGAPFSIWPWDNFGDHAGLDQDELAFIQSELNLNHDAELTIIFGHHPFERGYSSPLDTGLTYGLASFLELIDDFGVYLYGFGHTHNYRENVYYKNLSKGVFYMNVASLGKSDQDHYAVMAIDNNGVSIVPAQKGMWPVVLITAPMDRCLGDCPNPFAYEVPQSPANPIRALVFDENPVSQVDFRIDLIGDWHPMQQVDQTPIWLGTWDATASNPGPHIIEVRAQGSNIVSDIVITSIQGPDVLIEDVMKWKLKNNGRSLKAKFKVRNAGKEDAGAFVVRYYHSESPDLLGTEIGKAKQFKKGLKAGKGKKISFKYKSMEPLSGYLVVALDADEQVDESDEENNSIAIELALPQQ